MNPAPPDITREDIEAKLKEVAEALNAASRPARQTALRVSVIAAALLVMAAYFLGKRRGRLARTFVELHRH